MVCMCFTGGARCGIRDLLIQLYLFMVRRRVRNARHLRRAYNNIVYYSNEITNNNATRSLLLTHNIPIHFVFTNTYTTITLESVRAVCFATRLIGFSFT